MAFWFLHSADGKQSSVLPKIECSTSAKSANCFPVFDNFLCASWDSSTKSSGGRFSFSFLQFDRNKIVRQKKHPPEIKRTISGWKSNATRSLVADFRHHKDCWQKRQLTPSIHKTPFLLWIKGGRVFQKSIELFSFVSITNQSVIRNVDLLLSDFAVFNKTCATILLFQMLETRIRSLFAQKRRTGLCGVPQQQKTDATFRCTVREEIGACWHKVSFPAQMWRNVEDGILTETGREGSPLTADLAPRHPGTRVLPLPRALAPSRQVWQILVKSFTHFFQFVAWVQNNLLKYAFETEIEQAVVLVHECPSYKKDVTKTGSVFSQEIGSKTSPRILEDSHPLKREAPIVKMRFSLGLKCSTLKLANLTFFPTAGTPSWTSAEKK